MTFQPQEKRRFGGPLVACVATTEQVTGSEDIGHPKKVPPFDHSLIGKHEINSQDIRFAES